MSKIPIRATPHNRLRLVEDLLAEPSTGEQSSASVDAKRGFRNWELVAGKDREKVLLEKMRCLCSAVCVRPALPQSRGMSQARQFARSIPIPTLRTSASYSTGLNAFPFGEQLAIRNGMLRITLPTAAQPGLFVLKGRLGGLWAAELVRVARQSKDLRGSIFDLEAVFPVDSAGEEALRKLSGFGAKFTAESVYGKDLCKRLKLHRVGTSKRENHKRRPGCSLANANDHRAHVAQLPSFAGAAADQHCCFRRGA